MTEVTREMIEAGYDEYHTGLHYGSTKTRFAATYLAMKALDPEIERLRGALELDARRFMLAKQDLVDAGEQRRAEVFNHWAEQAREALSQTQSQAQEGNDGRRTRRS